MADKYVYDFEEGNKDMKYLLGGKGANLAEMTNMGLPVPHGFTVTCEACNAYRAAGRRFPEGMLDEVAGHLRALQQKMARRLGDPGDPLVLGLVARALDGALPRPPAPAECAALRASGVLAAG